MGDACFLTFPESPLAVAAVEFLTDEWEKFMRRNHVSCSISIAIHKGDLYLFRSYLYGEAINVTARLNALASKLSSADKNYALISGRVGNEVTGGVWEKRLQQIELPEDISLPKEIDDMFIYELRVSDGAA